MATEQIKLVNDFGIERNEQVGDYLRRVRETRGLDLEHLAKSIRLGKNILQAIEDNQWDKFPTEAYLRSYIASICEKLSVDKMIVLKKFSIDRNSHFSIAVNIAEDQDTTTKSSNTAKIAIITIIAVIIILFFISEALNGKPNKNPVDEASPYTSVETEIEALDEDSTENISDTLSKSESIPESPPPVESTATDNSKASKVPKTEESIATDDSKASKVPKTEESIATDDSKVSKVPRTQDTLRFECIPASNDNTCGISLRGYDSKMYYFTRVANRSLDRNDTMQLTITVPWRTKMFVNGTEVKIGKFNTLMFYNGQIVDSKNRNF